MRSQPKETEYYEEEVSAGNQRTTIRVEALRPGELQRDFEWRLSVARNQALGKLLRIQSTRQTLVTGQGRADNDALQSILHARGVKTAAELLPMLTGRSRREHHNKYKKFTTK